MFKYISVVLALFAINSICSQPNEQKLVPTEQHHELRNGAILAGLGALYSAIFSYATVDKIMSYRKYSQLGKTTFYTNSLLVDSYKSYGNFRRRLTMELFEYTALFASCTVAALGLTYYGINKARKAYRQKLATVPTKG